MKKCSICGIDDTKTRIILSNGKHLCRKHYHQIRKYGHEVYSIYDDNEIILKEDHAEIILKFKTGEVAGTALIDLNDVGLCKKYKWHLKQSRNTDYAITTINEKEKLFMHRLVLNYEGELDVDHINHNGLDNRKKNLRIITHQKNLINQYNDDNGICKVKSGRYRASICKNGKTIYIGTYDTEEEAIKNRKMKERELF